MGTLPPHRMRAFSLLELVMVMAILVVMAGIALPRFGAAHMRYSVDLAARRIEADLAYAQATARQRSSVQEVAFDTAADTYTLIGMEDLDRAGAAYGVALSEEPYRSEVVSVSFENTDGHVGDQGLRFDMWGQPESGNPNQGAPYARLVAGSVVIGAGTETRTITIAPVTGKVSIQ